MARNTKPIGLHLAEGNPNRLTKAEIARREKAEVKLGSDKVTCPRYVIADPVAYKKWRDLIYDFNKAKASGIEIVKSSDAGILARYCMTFSEFLRLLDHRNRIDNLDMDPAENIIAKDALEERFGKSIATDLFNKVEYLLSVGGILALETAINKKGDMLIKMEDRLFLNPLAKVKNIPKKEPVKDDPLKDKGFGNV